MENEMEGEMEPVTTVLRDCVRCDAGELEVVSTPRLLVIPSVRESRCLACGMEYRTHWWPGEFERAQQSATYAAA